jgi:hypothetical protein
MRHFILDQSSTYVLYVEVAKSDSIRKTRLIRPDLNLIRFDFFLKVKLIQTRPDLT